MPTSLKGCRHHQWDAHGLTSCLHSVVMLPTLVFSSPGHCCAAYAHVELATLSSCCSCSAHQVVIVLPMLMLSSPHCHCPAYAQVLLAMLLSCCLCPCSAGHIIVMLPLLAFSWPCCCCAAYPPAQLPTSSCCLCLCLSHLSSWGHVWLPVGCLGVGHFMSYWGCGGLDERVVVDWCGGGGDGGWFAPSQQWCGNSNKSKK